MTQNLRVTYTVKSVPTTPAASCWPYLTAMCSLRSATQRNSASCLSCPSVAKRQALQIAPGPRRAEAAEKRAVARDRDAGIDAPGVRHIGCAYGQIFRSAGARQGSGLERDGTHTEVEAKELTRGANVGHREVRRERAADVTSKSVAPKDVSRAKAARNDLAGGTTMAMIEIEKPVQDTTHLGPMGSVIGAQGGTSNIDNGEIGRADGGGSGMRGKSTADEKFLGCLDRPSIGSLQPDGEAVRSVSGRPAVPWYGTQDSSDSRIQNCCPRQLSRLEDKSGMPLFYYPRRTR